VDTSSRNRLVVPQSPELSAAHAPKENPLDAKTAATEASARNQSGSDFNISLWHSHRVFVDRHDRLLLHSRVMVQNFSENKAGSVYADDVMGSLASAARRDGMTMRRGKGPMRQKSLWPLMVGACLFVGAGAASAQDLELGKSPAQLFSSNCTGCHKTAQGLAAGKSGGALAAFLKQHYTTGTAPATALAAYLAAAGPAPASRAASKPQPPAAVERGASRNAAAPTAESHPKPAEAAKPRNPAPPVARRHPGAIPSVESDPAPVAISHEPLALPAAPPTAAHEGAGAQHGAAGTAHGQSAASAAAGAAAAVKQDQAGFSSPLP
jgi:hypothetical protein